MQKSLFSILPPDIFYNIVSWNLSRSTLHSLLCSSKELSQFAKENPGLISCWYKENISNYITDELLWNYRVNRQNGFWLVLRKLCNQHDSSKIYHQINDVLMHIICGNQSSDLEWKSTVILALLCCSFKYYDANRKSVLVPVQLTHTAIRYSTHNAEAIIVQRLLKFSDKTLTNWKEMIKDSSIQDDLLVAYKELPIIPPVTFRCDYKWIYSMLQNHQFDILDLLIENQMQIQNEQDQKENIQDAWKYLLNAMAVEANKKALLYLVNKFQSVNHDDYFPSIQSIIPSLYSTCISYNQSTVLKFLIDEIQLEIPFHDESLFRELFLTAITNENEESIQFLLDVSSTFPIAMTLNNSEMKSISEPWYSWCERIIISSYPLEIPLLCKWRQLNPLKSKSRRFLHVGNRRMHSLLNQMKRL